jgi:putative transcriptional regulator
MSGATRACDNQTDRSQIVDGQVLPDGSTRPLERQARLKRVPQVKVMRRAMGLAQEDFSARFRIPLGTLRDWEQGKTEPDQAARAYLTVIARDPEAVRRALRSGLGALTHCSDRGIRTHRKPHDA